MPKWWIWIRWLVDSFSVTFLYAQYSHCYCHLTSASCRAVLPLCCAVLCRTMLCCAVLYCSYSNSYSPCSYSDPNTIPILTTLTPSLPLPLLLPLFLPLFLLQPLTHPSTPPSSLPLPLPLPLPLSSLYLNLYSNDCTSVGGVSTPSRIKRLTCRPGTTQCFSMRSTGWGDPSGTKMPPSLCTDQGKLRFSKIWYDMICCAVLYLDLLCYAMPWFADALFLLRILL